MENNTENQQESEQPEILTSDVRNRSIKPKWLWWILGIVVVITLGIIGYYTIRNLVSAEQQKYIGAPNNIADSPSSITDSPIDSNKNPNKPVEKTIEWQTYENDKYNFSIDYPIDWVVEESGSIIGFRPENTEDDINWRPFDIEIISKPLSQVIDDQGKINGQLGDTITEENIVINGSRVTRYNNVSDSPQLVEKGNHKRAYLFVNPNNNTTYKLSGYYFEKSQNYTMNFDKMVASFVYATLPIEDTVDTSKYSIVIDNNLTTKAVLSPIFTNNTSAKVKLSDIGFGGKNNCHGLFKIAKKGEQYRLDLSDNISAYQQGKGVACTMTSSWREVKPKESFNMESVDLSQYQQCANEKCTEATALKTGKYTITIDLDDKEVVNTFDLQ